MISNIGSPFCDPSVQFFSNTGTVLASGTVEFWLAGTSTHVNTYSDQGLSSANANPLTLDSAGRATIYFTPVNGTTSGISIKYTLKDSAGSTIRTVDNVTVPVATAGGNLTGAVVGYGASTTLTISGNTVLPVLNRHMLQPEGLAADQLDTLTITGLPDGALLVLGNITGVSAPITVRSGIGNITLTGALSCVLSETSDRLTLIRQGSSFIEVVRSLAAGPSTPSGVQFQGVITQGRLTLASTVPIRSIDVTGTTLYFTPFHGNVIALPQASGVAFTLVAFSQVSIAIPATTFTVYDVFGYNNAGNLSLELAAWSSPTSRGGAGFTTLSGVYVSAADQTRKYLGTFGTGATSGTGEDTYQHRYVWNYYNRVQRPLKRQESTNSWAYNTAAWRQANGSTSNEVGMVVGFLEDPFHLAVYGLAQATAAQSFVSVGIGHATTTTAITSLAVTIPGAAVTANEWMQPCAVLDAFPDLGMDNWNWLEYGNAAGTTFFGDNGIPPPSGQIQTGIIGWTWG